jgi:hypothetical protein
MADTAPQKPLPSTVAATRELPWAAPECLRDLAPADQVWKPKEARRLALVPDDIEPTPDGAFEVIGKPGMPWSGGRLRLETHPDLDPLSARGRGTDTGRLWQLRSLPQVRDALEDLIGTVATAPWQLARRELPDWVADDPDAIAAEALTWDVSRQIWQRWQEAEYSLLHWHTDALQYGFMSGFYLGETSAKMGRVWHKGSRHEIPILQLPELRAPWTVSDWLLQGERPVGVVQTLPYSYGDELRTAVIPWERLHHFTLFSAGPTDLEGTSSVRPAYEWLHALAQIYRLQALAITVNALGTWTGRPIDGTLPSPDGKQEAFDALNNMQAVHVPVIISDTYILELLSPQDAVPDLSPQVGIYERLVALSLRTSHKLIGLVKHGSFAARAQAGEEASESYTYPTERLQRATWQYLRRALALALPELVESGHLYMPDVVYVDPDPDPPPAAKAPAPAPVKRWPTGRGRVWGCHHGLRWRPRSG